MSSDPVSGRSLRVLPLYLGLAAVGLVVVVAAGAVLVAVRPAGSTEGGTPTPVSLSTPSPARSCAGSEVRWLVGLGTGTEPAQIEAERKFVAAYNQSQTCTLLSLVVVPNASAYDVLKTEIAQGHAPDIIGPVGTRGMYGLDGLVLDLRDEMSFQSFDSTAYEPAVMQYLTDDSGAQIGLPYQMYPGFIFYNKDLFARASLPDLPTKVGETYQGRTWDWNELGRIAALLTIDKNGKKSGETGYDRNYVVQYGLAFDWADARRVASCFGGGSFVESDGRTSQIPAVWREAWSWYHDAAWKTEVIIPAHYSAIGGQDGWAGRGAVAMSPYWPWGLNGLYSGYSGNVWEFRGARSWPGAPAGSNTEKRVASAAIKGWGMSVMPSWEGQTSSPLDMDSFSILASSKNPDDAFLAMTAIMADIDLRVALGGGMPARIPDQGAWIAARDAQQAALFPGNLVDWTVLQEMSRHPAVPSHEAGMPNLTQSLADVAAFYQDLRYGLHDSHGNDLPYDVSAELDKLKAKLQTDFDAVAPIYQE
jgi:multiple sugar transport system substrate-binding protein